MPELSDGGWICDVVFLDEFISNCTIFNFSTMAIRSKIDRSYCVDEVRFISEKFTNILQDFRSQESNLSYMFFKFLYQY